MERRSNRTLSLQCCMIDRVGVRVGMGDMKWEIKTDNANWHEDVDQGIGRKRSY